ncbi:FAD binding domain of DNA photolyase domain-containing protein [Phthorimaea operculella]|nr:FAD binding domain of DNA photolyase domain-containing protein [Phthorimaea operculella]
MDTIEKDLDASLRKLNSRLFVVRGQPADALPKLFRDWGTTTLTFEEDPEPYGRVRDHNIMTKCREVGINVISQVSHTLYKLDSLIELNGGKAPLTYHQFQALIASMPPPALAEATITKQTLNGAVTPIAEDHDEKFGVPTLEELGFDVDGLSPPVWVGGESEALGRLERHLERKAWVASFGNPKMTPQSLLASQTGLSPYLRFGCLSTRLFYYQLTALYKRVKRVRPPLSLHGQILWREFFYCAATRNPNFDRMEGNPICVQIPWDNNQEALAKWANGQTGFPWIDAIMIQLREEGWIHHLARHAVACFLTRGDLWISWEEGMKVFDELLLDADWSVNAGMWMWLSCSSFFQQFFHCYCPVRFGRKTDPNGDFIRRYIPVLKNMPTRYIHEPWVAPESVQVSAKCVVGRDYPLPMVDHAKASQLNIERIKQVYAHLAKFKPQGTLNPNPVQRPNMMQSSPSPTSIITSINQSNYLCSKTPEPQVSTAPTAPLTQQPPLLAPYSDDGFQFQHPGKAPDRPRQVYISHKPDHADSLKRAQTPTRDYNAYRTNLQQTAEKHKYDYKSYALTNNYITQSFPSPQQMYRSQPQLARNEILYSKEVKLNTFDDGKVKLFISALSENAIRLPGGYVHNQVNQVVQQRYIAPLSQNYCKEITDAKKEKQQKANNQEDTHMQNARQSQESYQHQEQNQTNQK